MHAAAPLVGMRHPERGSGHRRAEGGHESSPMLDGADARRVGTTPTLPD